MAVTWPSKDPDAVLDYVYRVPLDVTDSIAPGQVAVTKLSGDVTIDSFTLAAAPDTTAEGYGQDVTLWLSGGTDGETSVFRIAWTTVATREDDAIVTLAIAAHELPVLALTGYAKPLPGHLAARYPAFASVDGSTVQYWLTDAERFVSAIWSEGDYAAGLMALAAHNMALAGLGSDAAALAGVPAGVTRMKSGSLELGFTEAAANARLNGSTRYELEYRTLLRRNLGGPIVGATGLVDAYDTYPPGRPW